MILSIPTDVQSYAKIQKYLTTQVFHNLENFESCCHLVHIGTVQRVHFVHTLQGRKKSDNNA